MSAKASRFRMEEPEIGISLDLKGHNAIQGHFLDDELRRRSTVPWPRRAALTPA